MKKFIALFIIAIMAVSLFACSANSSKGIIGTWKGEIDVTDAIISEIGDEKFDVSGIKDRIIVPVSFNFKDEKNVEASLDADACAESIKTFMNSFGNVMVDYYYDYFAELGYEEEDADELFIEQYGVGLKEYINQTISEMDYNELLDEGETSFTSTYELKDGKIILDGNEDDYIEYTLENDTLTFVSASSSENSAFSGAEEIMIFPMVLKR